MNDKGFSPWLREIVGAMLDPRPRGRPDALELVSRAEEGWRTWRANTRDGREYVDAGDRILGNQIEHTSRGPGLVGSIQALKLCRGSYYWCSI